MSTISVDQLLLQYRSLGVPHFQRGSVWGRENVSALLESLYFDTPCGSIILWQPKRIEEHGVPLVPGATCRRLLIDGQQRTRSLHEVFGRANGTYPVPSLSGNEASRVWSINLNQLDDFDGLLQAPAKRTWSLFEWTPDPGRAEDERLQRVAAGKMRNGDRYTIPESPFKYHFVPLRHFFEEASFLTLIAHRQIFVKVSDDAVVLDRLVPLLESVRVKVRAMKTRLLFLKELGPEIDLAKALRVFVRINSGGRAVEEEEKGFSILVGEWPGTNDRVSEIFRSVHGDATGNTPAQRDEVLKRRQERHFGFKLFIRVFMLAVAFHAGRPIGTRTMTFKTLRDRRFLKALEQSRDLHDRVWRGVGDSVVALHRLLVERLYLDALQFLPETTSLLPLFLLPIKYPDVLERDGNVVRVRKAFRAGLAQLALLLLLKDMSKRAALSLASDVARTDEELGALIHRLETELAITDAALERCFHKADSLNNRYTLLLYGLERSRGARDFNYRANLLTLPAPEVPLNQSCDPEKQHIVPYSLLMRAFELERRSVMSATPVNNIGNITFISRAQNSLQGLSNRLTVIDAEPSENLRAHFMESSGGGYESVRKYLEQHKSSGPEGLKRLYLAFIESRRGEIANGFAQLLGQLHEEWLAAPKTEIRPAERLFNDAAPSKGRNEVRSRRRLDRQGILDGLGNLAGQGHREAVVLADVIEALRPLGVYADKTKQGIAVRCATSNGSAEAFRLARVVRTSAMAKVGKLREQLRQRGLPDEPAVSHLKVLAAWCDGARVDRAGILKVPNCNNDEIPVSVLAKNRAAYEILLRQTISAIRKLSLDE